VLKIAAGAQTTQHPSSRGAEQRDPLSIVREITVGFGRSCSRQTADNHALASLATPLILRTVITDVQRRDQAVRYVERQRQETVELIAVYYNPATMFDACHFMNSS